MNSLRQYLDILAEADAPAPTNPWTNDPVKAAAWEKLSPQMKANIGGADPTDKIIISAMADGSGWGRAKGINDANPDGTPKATLTPQQQAQNVLQPGMNSTTPAATATAQSGKPAPAADPEKEKKVARFKELLTKAGMLTATPAASSDFKADYNLAPTTATGPGIKLAGAPGGIKESVAFKSSIGRMLLESFDLALDEAGALDKIDTDRLTKTPATGASDISAKPAAPAKAPAAPVLSKEEYSELSKLYGDLSVTYKDDAALAPLFTAYNNVKPSWSSDAQAPAPAASAPTAPAAGNNLGIAQMQKELKAQGADLGTFGPNKDGIDGKMGKFTRDAMVKYPEIAKKYGFKDSVAAAPAAPAAPAQSGKPTVPVPPGGMMSGKDALGRPVMKGSPNDVSGNQPAPLPGVASLPNVPATGKVDQSGKPAPTATAPAADPNIAQIPATADKKQPYWVAGTRYEWQATGQRDPSVPYYKPMNGWVKTAEPGEKLQWNATRNRSRDKFTGADSDYGKQPATPVAESSFTNDEVSRIVSLVHYR